MINNPIELLGVQEVFLRLENQNKINELKILENEQMISRLTKEKLELVSLVLKQDGQFMESFGSSDNMEAEFEEYCKSKLIKEEQEKSQVDEIVNATFKGNTIDEESFMRHERELTGRYRGTKNSIEYPNELGRSKKKSSKFLKAK